jgi:elongation factor P hydroxylase
MSEKPMVSMSCGSLDNQLLTQDCEDLIILFNQLFSQSLNTRLVRGDGEPVYLPASEQCAYHQVIFAHGFFSSALHEIAHWCIAGDSRRQQIDYGYWYAADGRNTQQQAQFEQVEVKPQALEWIFAKACAKSFRVSVDNLNGEQSDPAPFKRAVHRQVLRYCEQAMPSRAEQFFNALCGFYCHISDLDAKLFLPSEC